MAESPVARIVDLDPVDLPLPVFFPGRELATLEPERHWLDKVHVDFDANTVRLAIQSYVLRMGGANVLIDACIGADKERPDRPHWHRRNGEHFLKALADAGYRPEDIHFVFCTHLHADHVGWNTRLENGKWVPTFPNARYLVDPRELDFWVTAAQKDPHLLHGSFADSVRPIIDAKRYTNVSPGDRFIDGGAIVDLAGHSPGQIGLDVKRADGPNILFCGDAIHSPVQVLHPEWTTFVCEDPAQAILAREKLLERAAGDNCVLMPAHLRGAEALRTNRVNGRWRPILCDCRGKQV